MSTNPTHATPRPKPSARPISIETARRERELGAAIERVRPAMERANSYYAALGIDPAVMACSAKAISLWNGRAAVSANTPRSVIF